MGAPEEKGLITFPDAASAVAWAEEVLDKQGAKSQLGALLKVKGYGEMTADEACDFAHTIVMIVARNKPDIETHAFCYHNGRYNHHRESQIIEELVRRMQNMIADLKAQPRKPETLQMLSLAVIRSGRELYLFGRYHPKARIERMAGIPKGELRQRDSAWFALHAMAKKAVQDWVDQADRALNQALKDRGFVA